MSRVCRNTGKWRFKRCAILSTLTVCLSHIGVYSYQPHVWQRDWRLLNTSYLLWNAARVKKNWLSRWLSNSQTRTLPTPSHKNKRRLSASLTNHLQLTNEADGRTDDRLLETVKTWSVQSVVWCGGVGAVEFFEDPGSSVYSLRA